MSFSYSLFEGLDAAWLVWGVPVVLWTLALVLVAPALRRRFRAYRLNRRLRRLGQDALEGVLVDNGLDGTTWIDYLLLRPEGIVLLELKAYRGLIFGAEAIDNWTQVLGTRSFKFPNPLTKHRNDLLAVRALVPDVPVFGRLVFSGGSEFPKGIPQGVVSLDMLWEEFGAPSGDVDPALRAAWSHLQASAVRPPGMSRHGDLLDAPQANRAGGVARAALLALLGVVWVAWQIAG